jgi:FKBP-type peptidyl-prolyl cis-trans isomerase
MNKPATLISSVYNVFCLLVWCSLAIPQSSAGLLRKAPLFDRTKSGFVIVQLSAGNEDAPLALAGDTVTVRYEGLFGEKSEKWDSAFLKAQPQKFVLGQNKAFKAIEEALPHMRMGSRATVWVPSGVACPELRVPPIPPTAEVGFDVEVVGIEGSNYMHRSVPEKRNP